MATRSCVVTSAPLSEVAGPSGCYAAYQQSSRANANAQESRLVAESYGGRSPTIVDPGIVGLLCRLRLAIVGAGVREQTVP
jgi:hypothetical protein